MGGVEYQVTKVDPTDPHTKGAVYQVHKVSEEVAATLGGKVYRARIINDPTAPTVAGKVYQIVLIGDPADPAVKGKVYNAILTGGSEAVVIGPAVSPLSLPDAVANSLQYVKAFGGAEQRNLPAGYTQVEYLESTGTQYIDTGIVLKSEATITMVAQADAVTSGGPYAFWGFMGSDTMPRWGWSIYSTAWLTDLNQTNTASTANTQKHTFVNSCFYTGTDLYYNSFVDGSPLFTNARAVTQVETYTNNTLSAYLFARNNNGTAGNFLSCKIFSFEVVQDGVKVLDLIPCRQNSNNVLGMYDTVSGQFFTNAGTGVFTAGANVVPSPDTPVDIVSNNGVLRYGQYGKNLFYPVLGTTDGLTRELTSDGRIHVFGTCTRTTGGFIIGDYVLPAGTYTLQCAVTGNAGSTTSITFNSLTTCSFGETKTISKSVDVNSSAGISITLGTTYDFYLSPMIEQGSTASEYEPYHFGIHTDGTVETIGVRGKNLIDESTLVKASATVWRYYSTTSQGGFNLKANTTYTLSTNNPNINVYFYDYETKTSIASGAHFKTYTPTEDVTVYFTLYLSAGIPDDTRIQLEIGNTATEYEPYFDGGTATAEMLLKVGDYQDEQEILSGAVTRKVGVKVLDGSENWGDLSSYNGFSLTLTDAIVGEKSPVVSTHEKQSTTFLQEGMILGGGIGNNVLYWTQIYSVIANNLTDFKQWLADQYAAGTPVIIVYPLEEPTTESVAGQALQVQAGDNVVEVTQASIDGLELEAQYEKEAD